jgi:glycosyltransferase 2 family protein
MNRWKNIAGAMFAFAVMGVVLYVYGGDLSSVDFADPALLRGLAAAVTLYVIVVVLGAFAWRVLLTAFGAKPAGWAAERQLLISQIGKYVPGNIAQYVGRAAMAIGAGTPANVVGISIIAETALIVVGGLLSVGISIAVAPQQAARVVSLLPDLSTFAWIISAIAAFVGLLVAIRIVSRRFRAFEAALTARWPLLVFAILIYTVALLVLGLSLYVIVNAISPVPLSLAVAVFAAAWIAGLATPGAPGGLGVRESVITLGLAPFVGGTAALSVALLHRGASVLGDVISFGLGLVLPADGNPELDESA